jgi:hypothetical protein
MKISVKSLMVLAIGVLVGGSTEAADARTEKQNVARDAVVRFCTAQAQARYLEPGGAQEIGVTLDCSPTGSYEARRVGEARSVSGNVVGSAMMLLAITADPQ